MVAPPLYDTHMHTPLCRHASGDVREYAAVAYERRIQGIIVTCHNPLPTDRTDVGRMGLDEFPLYLQMVEQAKQEWTGRVDVRLGLECDWLPGMESWLATQTHSAGFDYILGSVHPHLRQYRALFWRGDIVEFHRIYFEQLALAAETGLFDCLSHPDVVKNVDPAQWNPDHVMPDIQRALDRIAAAGVAMELNTSGELKELPEMNPGPRILAEMRQRSIPVVIGSDAHWPQRVGDGFEWAMDLLEATGYDRIGFFLGRKRQEIAIADARRRLNAPAGHPDHSPVNTSVAGPVM